MYQIINHHHLIQPKQTQNGEDAQNSFNQIDSNILKPNSIDTNDLCEEFDQISDHSTIENDPEVKTNTRINHNETLEEATNHLFFKGQV